LCGHEHDRLELICISLGGYTDMVKRALFYSLFPMIVVALGSCSYGSRYVVINSSPLPLALEYRLRPDTADACPKCRLGFAVTQPRWITADSTTASGYRWCSADSTEYRMGLGRSNLRFQLSVPPGGMVEIYEHTSLDDYRHIPFRLIALEATVGGHRVSGEGEAAKRLFRKQAHWYALKITQRIG
jgi:hypothetical protein